MRWHLRQTFDKIYVLDLHGNSNKKETAPDGSEDKNVFDIKTGVSIIFGVRKQPTSKNKPLATVFKADMFGKRAKKFADLDTAKGLADIEWVELPADNSVWLKQGKNKNQYETGFSVADLFKTNTVGIVTSRDAFVIDSNKNVLTNRIDDFVNLEPGEAEIKYSLKENKKWKIADTQQHSYSLTNVVPISYRPFDNRYIYYHDDFIERSRKKVMRHLLQEVNLGLNIARQVKAGSTWQHTLVSSGLVESSYVSNKTSEIGTLCPLYLYAEDGDKVSNLDKDIVCSLNTIVGETTPEDVLDYVYAVLHSPEYRTKYVEFLKSDFPRVPYPTDKETFWQLVPLGTRLRELHLLTHPDIRQAITTFPEAGDDTVTKPAYKDGRVHINDTQYWDGVPEAVWNFYVGGYQPAQKYLKDRKDKKLTSDEFANYERMIASLNETIKVMTEIDKVMS